VGGRGGSGSGLLVFDCRAFVAQELSSGHRDSMIKAACYFGLYN
jgi:hypothetical protein